MDSITQPPLLQAAGLSKIVETPAGSITILANIDLVVQAGESLAILGASGSGKSTLLGLLAGLDRPSAGDIRTAGISLTLLDEDGRAKWRAGQVGFVFQFFNLLPALTALENVMLPLELAGFSDARTRAKEILTRTGLDSRYHHYPRQLSGGEQQRVALARAFITQPKLLFADEPTGNLDQNTGAQIIDLLFELNKERQTTLILVTHDEKLAQLCQRQIYLAAGQIVN